MPLDFIRALPGETLKIEIMHGVRVNDASAAPGDVVDVSVFDGRYLIGSGRAKLYEVPVPAVAAPEAVASVEVSAPEAKVAKKNSKKTETT